MRFDRKNPRFVTDMATMLFSITVIVLTIIVIVRGEDSIMAAVFYAGAGMFATNIIKGLITGRYAMTAFIIPAVLCITGGLIAQGMIGPWIF